MPAFGFVADDLTGAADVLAQAHRYGLEAALVIGDAPLPMDTDVVGFAGPARSLAGAAFDNLVTRDLAGIAASTGSACQAGVAEPSHVVMAMGRSEQDARSVLRFTLGRTSTDADVDAVLATIADAHFRASGSGSAARS